MTESELQTMVADYLKLQYPDVLFHSDFGSGIKLTKGQAIKQKRQNGGRRGWPDMFLAEPSKNCNGLFIELKAKGVRLKKKDGSWASTHLEEQNEVLNQLQKRGYAAYFAVGFDEAKEIIDDYLSDGRN